MCKLHYIKTDYLIDGSGAPVQKNVLLAIQNGIIDSIEPFNGDNAPREVLDLSQCTILPPFVDCHVHLCLSGSTDEEVRRQQLLLNCRELYPRIGEHLHYHFSHGVLAVRDGGDRGGCTLQYKNTASDTGHDPVIIKSAGPAWHRYGRYGSFIGQTPGADEPLVSAVSREKNLADHIKVINSGLNSLTTFGRETPPQFSVDELKELVRLAKEQGKKVMVHANGKLPVRMAIEAGCHSIEHGFFMGGENLKAMADAQTTWVPTVVTMHPYETLPDGESKPGSTISLQIMHHQLEQMALAREYGVPVALGTDSGSRGILHGESFATELKLILKAGYSLTQAIQCASANGAGLLDLDEIGLLTKGRPATFIVARATPAMLPRKLSYLEAIYINGRPCDTQFFHKF